LIRTLLKNVWNATCVMIHLFDLFSIRECMLDLFIEMKFAEASFDQDSMKKCLECYLCDVSFVCSIFINRIYGGSVH
jgi:hypothetical protein